MRRLAVAPIRLREANAFVERHHRHHGPARGCMWSLGAWAGHVGPHGVSEAWLAGVAVVGRPVARLWDDGATVEVLRLATDGTENACSFLLGVVRRLAAVLELRVVTYTLPSEGGASLRAAGFRDDGPAGGGSWSRAGRPRVDAAPTTMKVRWLWEGVR